MPQSIENLISNYIIWFTWTGGLFLDSHGQYRVIYRSHCFAGITAASGIAAELGIPLTHRGVANSVRFLTGHSRKGGTDPLFVAESAADPDSTLVVYMGLSTLPSLATKLIHHGLPPNTPAAAVERGTTPQQRIVSYHLYILLCSRKLLIVSSLKKLIFENFEHGMISVSYQI